MAVVAVAAVVVAAVLYVRGTKAQSAAEGRVREAEAALNQAEALSEANLRHADEVNQAALKSKDEQIENLKSLYEEKLRGKDEAAAGLEKNYQAQIKSKDEYIENLNKVHAEALRKSDEVHAEAVRKLEAQQAEAVRKLEAQQAEAMKKVAEQHAKDMELMQTQFKVAAAEILSRNTQDFSKSSTEKIDTLLRPVREKFDEFSRKVEESDKGRVEMKTSIEEQVRSIMGQAAKVSASADNLASALTNRSKTQGDFGELILKDILLNAGLVEGVHFSCQGVITDENGHEIKSPDGKTMIPDVQVYYPDGSVVVVDSKVSLTDYVTYCSETDEGLRAAALKRHIESVRKHVNELADKDYAAHIPEGKHKVDYNIMFIPNDGAFLAVLDSAPLLWQEARDRKVLIVSQMNLVVVLNMIQLVWKQSEREKNVDAVVAAASELMGQLEGWMAMYEDIGTKITKLSEAYDTATKKLTTSNQSVVQKVRKLEKLGAAPKLNAAKSSSRRSGRESIIPRTLAEGLSSAPADE